jgi:hypothetical protein
VQLPPAIPWKAARKSAEELKLAEPLIEQYLNLGVLKRVSPQLSLHRLPWFVLTKIDSSGQLKHRLICNARQINKFLRPQPFRMDHWAQIFPFLKHNWWGAKIDLKDAYFHLGVNESFRRYLHLDVGGKIYEFQAAPFGLSNLPQVWTLVMKTFLRKWRAENILVFIYLDDILLLGPTKDLVSQHLQTILHDLEGGGMLVNTKKSILEPSQLIPHLGFVIDFSKGLLRLPPEKIKAIRVEFGKLVRKKMLTCRKMAAILGSVRSFLMALPFLRAFSDQMVRFVARHRHIGWDSPSPVPLEIADQVRELHFLTTSWAGRPFYEQPIRKLFSDASLHGWGGLDPASGACVQEFWRSQTHLHINVKELQAALDTVRSLARPGDRVICHVDNLVAYSYLQKQGGRLPAFNRLMRPFLRWCFSKDITVSAALVASQEQLADSLSRTPRDIGDYRMDRALFRHLRHHFRQWIRPRVDMFASPGNRQLNKFVSRHPHWQAWGVDALRCPLESLAEVYANPPWTIISAWLVRLMQNPHLRCLTVLPWWASTSWWPLLARLHVPLSPVVQIQPFQGMFQDCYGNWMPRPKWPLVCILLSGASWSNEGHNITPTTVLHRQL